MKPGMDRGNKGTDRRTATSRTSKTDTSRRVNPQSARPATGRMNAQSPGTARREEAPQRGGQAQPQQDKTMLYVGIGGGALVFAIILAFMVSGGESGGHGGSGGAGGQKMVERAINEASLAFQRGEYRNGLDIAEKALSDPRAPKASSYGALKALANTLRVQVNLDRDGQLKVA